LDKQLLFLKIFVIFFIEILTEKKRFDLFNESSFFRILGLKFFY